MFFTTIVKGATVALIPKLIADLYSYVSDAVPAIFDDDEPKEPEPTKPRKKLRKRKLYDMTPMSKEIFDFVKIEHTTWKNNKNTASNGIHYRTQVEFCNYLNRMLELNKSTAVYSNIFNGIVKRKDFKTEKAIVRSSNEKA